MGRFIYILYNIFFVQPLIFISAFAGLAVKKLKLRKIEEKKYLPEFSEKFKKKKGEKRILFHCSSLGEWEQAAPLVDIIKKNHPYINIIVSFFSISGYNHVKNNPNIDEKIFLPFDSYNRACNFFEVIKPNLWVISAYDVWPNHVMAAKKNKVPIVIISATLAETSGRNKGFSGMLNKYIFKNIHAIYSRSSHDSKRFLKIYPFPEKILTYGDTRADRVYEKSINIRKSESIKIFKEKSDTDIIFIGGSTWPADEKVVLPGIINLLKKYTHLKAIIVPHEIKEDHINEIEDVFKKHDIKTERYTDLIQNDGTIHRVAIINTIGILAKLYKDTHIAYVGGSFGKGVHNVLEPAVFGMPVLFGPKHKNSQEAISLLELGVTFCVKSKQEFVLKMEKLIDDEVYREKCSLKAIGYIKNNLGACGKIYQHLLDRFDFVF